MQTLSLSLPLFFRITLVKKRALTKFSFAFTLVFLLFLSIAYIFQINAEVSERYLLSTYEKERTEVLKGKEMIEINILQNNSLQGVFSSLESDSSGFVKPDRINYLRIVGNRVVSR